MKRFFVPTFAVLLLISPAYANDEVALSDQASFTTQWAKIQAEMVKGGEYGEISPEDRDEVRRRFEAVAKLLETSEGNAGSLSADRQVEVFNHQAAINQILTQARKDSRVVCSRERKTGSKFPTNRCVTVAEARREREGARDFSRTLNRTMGREEDM